LLCASELGCRGTASGELVGWCFSLDVGNGASMQLQVHGAYGGSCAATSMGCFLLYSTTSLGWSPILREPHLHGEFLTSLVAFGLTADWFLHVMLGGLPRGRHCAERGLHRGSDVRLPACTSLLHGRLKVPPPTGGFRFPRAGGDHVTHDRFVDVHARRTYSTIPTRSRSGPS